MQSHRTFSHPLRPVAAVLSLLLAAALLRAQTAQSPQADPLEQAIRSYVIDPDIADLFRTVIAGLPPQIRGTYAQSLTEAIEHVAQAKRDHGRVLSEESPMRVIFSAYDFILRAADDATKQRIAPAWNKYMDRAKAEVAAQEAKGGGKVDGNLIVVLDAIQAAPKTDAPESPAAPPSARPDAMREAIHGISNPVQQAQAQQVLNRMHPEVRQALEDIWKELGPQFQIPYARALLLGLTAELNRAPGSPPAGAGFQGAADLIKQAATFPGRLDSVASSVNAITRHSSSYTDVDWKPALAQYNRNRQSPYLEANLRRMLAQALYSAVS